VIAVVEEEHDLTADLFLYPPGGYEFGVQKLPWEETTGLLAKTNDGRGHQERGECRRGGDLSAVEGNQALIAGVAREARAGRIAA
jgi:hypothetical protein